MSLVRRLIEWAMTMAYLIHDKLTDAEIEIKVRKRIRHRATRFVLSEIKFLGRYGSISLKGIIMGAPVAVQMNDVQTATLTVKAVDADGNAAPVAAPPSWTTDDASGTLTPAADGMSATYKTTALADPATPHKITVTGNGQLPDGTADPNDVITQEFDVSVVASEATQFVGSATVA